MYKYLFKPFLFRLKAETAHHLIFKSLKVLMKLPGAKFACRSFYVVKNSSLEREVFGLKFPNPVGLAAGFDKDAKLFDELSCFGFGFIEIGTLTPEPQPGNPKPRLFRLPLDNALVNRMGFNNNGVKPAVKRLSKRRNGLIIGGNIGKNKVTPNEQALNDYEKAFNELYPVVDYFVVNVSSPNTPNLRELQEKGPLTELLKHIMAINFAKPHQKPVLLKIAPDLSDTQLDDIVEIVEKTGVNGIIATNTTISRGGLKSPQEIISQIGKGGVSGEPLKKRATEVIRYLVKKSEGEIPVIGVGGISTPEDAIEKLEAGAVLVQIYSGFIYEGPSAVRNINKRLLKYSS